MSDVANIRAKLDEKIPRDVISLRDAGQGRKLSYLEGWYVIDRMNQIFGQGNWSYYTDEMRHVHSGTIDSYGKITYTSHYIANVSLHVVIDGKSVCFNDYGYGDGSDKANPGKAHELAVKEAVTDGIKRCAKSLGMSLGLALYDKTQENVDDNAQEVKSVGHAPAPEIKPAARGGDTSGAKGVAPASVAVVNPVKARITGKEGAPVEGKGAVSSYQEIPEDRERVNMLIKSTARVVISQRKKSPDELGDLFKNKFKVTKLEDLSDTQAKGWLTELYTMIG